MLQVNTKNASGINPDNQYFKREKRRLKTNLFLLHTSGGYEIVVFLLSFTLVIFKN